MQKTDALTWKEGDRLDSVKPDPILPKTQIFVGTDESGKSREVKKLSEGKVVSILDGRRYNDRTAKNFFNSLAIREFKDLVELVIIDDVPVEQLENLLLLHLMDPFFVTIEKRGCPPVKVKRCSIIITCTCDDYNFETGGFFNQMSMRRRFEVVEFPFKMTFRFMEENNTRRFMPWSDFPKTQIFQPINPITMDQKTINAAAKEYALDQLGKEQFDNNKAAVRAIADDFKGGVSWFKKLSKTSDPEAGYFFLTRDSNMAKNKLQQSLLEISKTWDKVLVRNSAVAIQQQLVDIVDALNSEYPRCAPLRVSFSNYETFDPTFYIKFGTDDTIMSLVFRKVSAECSGLVKGGISHA